MKHMGKQLKLRDLYLKPNYIWLLVA